MRDSKGPGNVRKLFMCAPNGKRDGIQTPATPAFYTAGLFGLKFA